MKVALLQAAGVPGDVAANLAAIRRAAHEAADGGARLIVFPEAFVTGYNIGAEMLLALAEPAGGEHVRALRTIAAEAGIAVLCGLPELDGDSVFNSAVLIDRDGEVLLAYRKTHLYGDLDRGAFRAGDALAPVVEIDGVRVGVLVCYDIEFPEAARALAVAGAHLVAVPTSLMEPSGWIAETLVPARAAENQVYVAYCNRVGTEGELDYVGLSSVCAPDPSGNVFAGNAETLLYADVDPAAVDEAKGRHDYLRDRRPGLY
ncbi:MAG: 5-aminopentanamidase [uncultured Solirubrobacteraceae bacterium]|uniref:5-aminopentanamidase n=1 Tax=uncultured Solirubrobacteraceae bacterium TaxID=1162706 RepID=A0A6J4SKU9_9ACTN|nr:MAG: 5-aminopentanamidase [uncultured Solirubrobacteraceae bacterium]